MQPLADNKNAAPVNETSYFTATLLAEQAQRIKSSEKKIHGSTGANAPHAHRQRMAGTGPAACRQRAVRLVRRGNGQLSAEATAGRKVADSLAGQAVNGH